MKLITLLVVVALFALAMDIWASGKSELETDGKKTKINAFAPDPAKDVVLTGKAQTVDMANDVAWGLTPSSNCTYRNHPTSARSGNYKTIYAEQERVRVVNRNAVFNTYSGAGCTGAILERQ